MREASSPLYFFWDYAITEEHLRDILRGENADERAWAISRIIQYARWEDIWKYVTLHDIQTHWEQLQWRTPELRDLWAYALEVWGVRR
jgi:hypothetical protein